MNEAEQDAEIRAAHSEAMVSQLLIAGLIQAMHRRGFDPNIFKEAFDYASDVAVASTYKNAPSDKGHSARVLEILDGLWKSVVGPQRTE
jgi:hypothetical protein